MIINRIFAMGNKYTFQIKPIYDLIVKYCKGLVTLIPFAGLTRFSELKGIYIDSNPLMNPTYIGKSEEIIPKLNLQFEACILDPPYTSFQTIKEYNGHKSQEITIYRDMIVKKLIPPGIVISLGYNSTGFSEKRNFEKVELLLVNLGGSHNDIIVLVEKLKNF